MSYAEMGYLPEAFFNFLSLLGWSPGDDRELLSRQDLIELFPLNSVGKANAVFGLDKLDWFNSQYIRDASRDSLREMVRNELESRQIWSPNSAALSPEAMDAAIELVKPRARKLSDFGTIFRAFFCDEFDYDQAAAGKFLKDPKLKSLIPALIEQYEGDETFTLQSTEEILRRVAEKAGVKAALLINAVRVALTGQGVAPGLFEIMQALGRQRTLQRLRRLEANLRLTIDE